MTISATSPFRVFLRVCGVLLALLGMWLSLDLLRITSGGAATNPLLAQQCGGAAPGQSESDCVSVLRSEFAYPSAMRAAISPAASQPAEPAAHGLPWAAVGAAYFAFVAVWYLFVGPPTRSRWGWHLVVAGVVGFGVALSVELTNVMASELKRYCIGCLAVHATNALLGLVTLLSFPWTRDRVVMIQPLGAAASTIPKGTVGAAPAERVAVVARHPSHGLALCTLLAAVLAYQLVQSMTSTVMLSNNLGGMTRAYEAVTNDPNFAYWQWTQQPRVEIAPRAAQPWLGDPNAPHTLVVFSDLQCPKCQVAFREITEQILPQHAGRLRVVFRHFPLDRACNNSSESTLHPSACRAATAVEAARQLGGPAAYEKMRAALYRGQNRLDIGDYSEFARTAGVDPAKLAVAMQAAEAKGALAEDIAAGEQLNLTSVPVLYLNGRRFDYWRDPQAWDRILAISQEAK